MLSFPGKFANRGGWNSSFFDVSIENQINFTLNDMFFLFWWEDELQVNRSDIIHNSCLQNVFPPFWLSSGSGGIFQSSCANVNCFFSFKPLIIFLEEIIYREFYCKTFICSCPATCFIKPFFYLFLLGARTIMFQE